MQAQFEQLFSNNLIQEIHFLMLFMENQLESPIVSTLQ